MVGSDGALNTDPPMAAILLLLSPCRGQDIKAVGWAPGIGFTLSWLAYGGGKKSQSPVDGLSWFIPLFLGVQPSKVVQDFFHPQYVDLLSQACFERLGS